MPTSEPRSSAVSLFESTFKHAPTAVATAPGRVNIIGEHIDYTGGFVMPIAIARHTVCAGSLAPETGELLLEAVSLDRPNEPVRLPLGDLIAGRSSGWGAYVAGVLSQCAGSSLPPRGVRLAFASSVPVGAGLSSSAALEVSTALVVNALLGESKPPAEVAKACRRAEHEFAGVPCGIMDQYISCMAVEENALFIDCVSETHRAVPIPHEVTFVIADTGKHHELSKGEYAERRASCERALAMIRKARDPYRSLRHCTLSDLGVPGIDPVDRKRARHAISECARVLATEQAFVGKRWSQAGDLMRQSHASLRDDYEVSCDELNTLADLLNATPGVHGARMTGAGFGGCVIALVHASRADEICEQLLAAGASRLVFQTRPAGAARLETLG